MSSAVLISKFDNHTRVLNFSAPVCSQSTTTLLVPENSDVSAESEMAHIISWSESNELKINLAKCKELVFKRPNLKHEISLCTLPDVVRVSVKLLGVYLDHTLCFHKHVEQIARNCIQQFYLLQQLRKQGLSDDCLKVLFHAIVLSKILYALSAWGGYTVSYTHLTLPTNREV